MKFKHLLTMALLAIGVSNAWAQTDLTSSLTNPSFESGNTNGWTNSGSIGWTMMNNNVANNPKVGTWFVEKWAASGSIDLNQTVQNLPAGLYSVSVNARNEAGNAVYVYGNDSENAMVRNLTARYTARVVLSENGDLKLGVKCASHPGSTWFTFDDFKLLSWGTLPDLSGATSVSGIDATSYIINPSFETGDITGWNNHGGTIIGSLNTTPGNNPKIGDWFVEKYWNADPFDFNQTITDLPAGKYSISVRARNESDKAVVVYANDATANITKNVTAEYSVDYLLPSAGSIKIGVKTADNHVNGNWFAADHFTLTYYGNPVCNIATPLVLGNNTVVNAGDVYSLEVPFDGEYSLAVPTGTVYTTNGNLTTSEVSDPATDGIQNLSAGTYYFVAGSDGILQAEASVKLYNLGSAAFASEGKYFQSFSGVKLQVTFPEASTTDSEATLALVSGAKATVNGTLCNLEAIAGGFAVDMNAISITAGTTYNISVPADVFGYIGQSTNEALTLTVLTPAIFDGTYYLLNTDTETYLSRGGNYGTQACVDEYGIAVHLRTNDTNETKIIFFDSYMNLGIDGWSYTDAQGDNVRSFNVQPVAGGYKFLCTSNSKYLAVNGTHIVNDAVEGVNLQGTTNVWALEQTSEHLANIAKNDDAHAAAAAAAAGISATTVAALDSYLNANYDEEDIAITGTNGTAKENYQGGSSNASASVELAIFAEETVTNLVPGLYKLTVNAFQRATWLDDVYDANSARGKVYVYANDVKTQLKSITEEYSVEAYTEGWNPNIAKDGKNYPNSLDAANQAFAKGMYENVVYVYVNADGGSTTGTLRFGIKNPTRLGNDGSRGAWTCFNNFSLVRLTQAEATMAVSAAAQYGTFCAPFAVEVPAGVEASTAEISGTAITLTSVGATIPANTPVVLFAESGLAAETFKGKTVAGTPTVGCLTGVYVSTPATVGSYVLQNNDSKVGFYRVAAGEEPTIGANRCYLTAPAGSNEQRAFFFGEEGVQTAIEGLNALVNGNIKAIYTLDGKMVDSLQKGVNVIKLSNGKVQKVIVK